MLSVKHSGVFEFIEERRIAADATNPDLTFPVYLKPNEIDWTRQRTGYKFQSLAKGVCFRVYLKSKTKRKFALEMLEYQYNYGSWRKLFDANPVATPGVPFQDTNLVEFKMETAYKPPLGGEVAAPFIRFRLEFLKLGAVQNLIYRATLRLCRLDETSNAAGNKCEKPVTAKECSVKDGECSE